MTYCAAFVTDHAIFLTADSAATLKPGMSIHDDTFFGEQSERDSHSILDSALKIIPIGENRVVAVAGDFDSIVSSINFLLEHGPTIDDSVTLFTSLENSLNLRAGSVTLICAERNNSELILGVWSAGKDYKIPKGKNGEGPHALSIGSGRKTFGYITENVMHMVRKYPKDKLHHSLVLTSTYHQLTGVHADLGKEYIGGAFFTVAMTNNGLVWQPDITYFIYSPAAMRESRDKDEKTKSFMPVNILVRDSIAFIERRVPKYRSIIMAGAASKAEIECVRQLHEKEVSEMSRNLACEYAIFLSRDDAYAVFLHRIKEDPYIRMVITANNLSITYAEDFYELLIKKPKIENKQGACLIEVVPRDLFSNDYTPPNSENAN